VAHFLSAVALGLDEFETLQKEKAYLAAAFGAPEDVFSGGGGRRRSQGQEPPGGNGKAGDLY
jgi:hypothetical protein